jgi:hypothetical protein
MDIVAWVVVWLVCLLLDSKVMGPNPAKAMDFKGNKNPHHIFLRMGSKAGGPMSRFYGRHVKKNTCKCERNACKAKSSLLLSIPPTCSQINLLVGLPQSAGGRVRSFPPSIISPWFSRLIYHLGDEQ